jgi:hypothetical protein
MRYTLRLLTLDQLSRAATLICALELERYADPDTLGPWPLEIGLGVGRAATPNGMGYKGESTSALGRRSSRRSRTGLPMEGCQYADHTAGRIGPAHQTQTRSHAARNAPEKRILEKA